MSGVNVPYSFADGLNVVEKVIANLKMSSGRNATVT